MTGRRCRVGLENAMQMALKRDYCTHVRRMNNVDVNVNHKQSKFGCMFLPLLLISGLTYWLGIQDLLECGA